MGGTVLAGTMAVPTGLVLPVLSISRKDDLESFATAVHPRSIRDSILTECPTDRSGEALQLVENARTRARTLARTHARTHAHKHTGAQARTRTSTERRLFESVALRCVALRCVALRCVALRCVALFFLLCVALPGRCAQACRAFMACGAVDPPLTGADRSQCGRPLDGWPRAAREGMAVACGCAPHLPWSVSDHSANDRLGDHSRFVSPGRLGKGSESLILERKQRWKAWCWSTCFLLGLRAVDDPLIELGMLRLLRLHRVEKHHHCTPRMHWTHPRITSPQTLMIA